MIRTWTMEKQRFGDGADSLKCGTTYTHGLTMHEVLTFCQMAQTLEWSITHLLVARGENYGGEWAATFYPEPVSDSVTTRADYIEHNYGM